MRVTFVLPAYLRMPVGGYRTVLELANRLGERGHDVTVVAPLLPTGLVDRAARRPASAAWRLASGIVELFTSHDFDWFDLHSRVSLSTPWRLTANGVPSSNATIATAWHTVEHVVDATASGACFWFIQSYESWDARPGRFEATLKLPCRKIVIARWLYDELRKRGVPHATMRHIPIAIDHDVYRLRRPIEDRPRRVCMLYHRAPLKGAADGIRALEMVKEAQPDLSAVLFGVRARPRDLPLWIDYVRRPSTEELVCEVYNASAIYLCPSHLEGWHLPPAEAMACGTAVVSTSIGGVRDYAVHEETALLAPVGDTSALANCVLELLMDDTKRRAIASAGRERIRAFTWEATTDKIEDWLAEVVVSPEDRQNPR